MRKFSCSIYSEFALALLLLAATAGLRAQQPDTTPIPDAPQPQTAIAPTEKDGRQKAEDRIREQEQQRIPGMAPSFSVSYRADAASLTAGQKMILAFRSSTNPFSFARAFLVAGYHEAMHDDVGFPWGIKGYGERSGAAYLDSFDATMIGGGILPVVLHQDPRYFRLGHGSTTRRVLYSVASNVICKHDNTGRWEPNYSKMSGNMISAAISNIYYPESDSAISRTFTKGLLKNITGSAGSLFHEFWPDLLHKFLHRDPTHGLDAQNSISDRTKKSETPARVFRISLFPAS
jgi:hypothetical protein